MNSHLGPDLEFSHRLHELLVGLEDLINIIFSKLNTDLNCHSHADLATTDSESDPHPQPLQLSVTAEGNAVPDEDPEYTLSLMKQPSTDGKCV